MVNGCKLMDKLPEKSVLRAWSDGSSIPVILSVRTRIRGQSGLQSILCLFKRALGVPVVAVYSPVHLRSVEKEAGSVPDDNRYL